MIEIGDFRLRKADDLNWYIEKHRIQKDGKNKGKSVWTNIGYYVDFRKAAQSLFEKLIKDGYEDTTDLQEVLDLLSETKEAIQEQIKKMDDK